MPAHGARVQSRPLGTFSLFLGAIESDSSLMRERRACPESAQKSECLGTPCIHLPSRHTGRATDACPPFRRRRMPPLPRSRARAPRPPTDGGRSCASGDPCPPGSGVFSRRRRNFHHRITQINFFSLFSHRNGAGLLPPSTPRPRVRPWRCPNGHCGAYSTVHTNSA